MIRWVAAWVLMGGMAGAALAADGPRPVPPLETIPALDVPRYMGVWFEIAKYPNSFQRQCVRNTRATYRLEADGTVQVINRCALANGEISEAIGAARQVGEAQSPKLKVRFAPAWLSFIPAVWGKYWVIDLDPQYRLVAVSEPSRQYLWILSRSPRVDEEAYAALLTRLGQQGFDIGKLESSLQDEAQSP